MNGPAESSHVSPRFGRRSPRGGRVWRSVLPGRIDGKLELAGPDRRGVSGRVSTGETKETRIRQTIFNNKWDVASRPREIYLSLITGGLNEGIEIHGEPHQFKRDIR
jgi:hypothetical protein